jgi:hypothetical protein
MSEICDCGGRYTDLEVLGCTCIRNLDQFLQEEFRRQPLLKSCEYYGLRRDEGNEKPFDFSAP